ncbi:MAG: phytanoyl-CoA dioxygenase family protein, partial [Pseudomonadota bacterium]
MQSAAEIAQFNRDGFLVIEDVIDPDTVAAVRAEYEALMDRLYDGWAKSGQVPPATPGMRFFDKISAAVKAGI